LAVFARSRLCKQTFKVDRNRRVVVVVVVVVVAVVVVLVVVVTAVKFLSST
jgi:hypothetical protein